MTLPPALRRIAHIRRLRVGSLVAQTLVICGFLLATTSLVSSAAEHPDYPGLPNDPKLANPPVARGSAVSEVGRARQWIRLPALYNLPAVTQTNYTDSTCRRSQMTDELGNHYSLLTVTTAPLYLGSSAGARAPFGILGPFRIRTAAFGSIPVEAEVRLEQRRDAEDLPIPFQFRATNANFSTSAGQPGFESCTPAPPELRGGAASRLWNVSAAGELNVSVTALRVDGVDVDLAGHCRAGQPASLDLTAPDTFAFGTDDGKVTVPGVPDAEQPWPENVLTSRFFSPVTGGLLTGTADIPAFTGCTTSTGEDLSRLLTATVSGPDNPVTLRSEGITKTDTGGCQVPSLYDHTCPALPELPFPASNSE